MTDYEAAIQQAWQLYRLAFGVKQLLRPALAKDEFEFLHTVCTEQLHMTVQPVDLLHRFYEFYNEEIRHV